MKLEPRPSNRQPGPWKELGTTEGVRIVEISDYNSFCQFVNIGFGDSDCNCLWRGQRRSEWKITSTLARSSKPSIGIDHLYNFRDAVARCTSIEYDISSRNPDAEDEKLKLWALGQHHGLLTPFIDWTVYPFVALFFALAEPDDSCETRAVYAIHWDEVRAVNFQLLEVEGIQPFKEKINNPPFSEEFRKYLHDNYGFRNEPGLEILKSSTIPPDTRDRLCKWEYERLKKEKLLSIYRSRATENKRIHTQGGLHLYTPNDISIDAWISSNHGKARIPLLTKIVLPNGLRNEGIKCLNKMNINFLTLFPDFEGAARHSNMALQERRWALGLREY